MGQTDIREIAALSCEEGKTQIEERIFNIRGKQVMIDKDLALLYGVETKRLNEQVKRNIERFPEDFMFQLTLEECLRSQIATLNQAQGKHLKYLPFAFTENGIAMLSSVLRSERRIVLIDNYIDDTVLTLMSKRASEVKATIYTGKISKQLQLDIDKHNAQYPPIEVRTFSNAHERRRGGQTGPSRSFMSVSVRDGTQKRCPEGENGTVTQSFGQKVA